MDDSHFTDSNGSGAGGSGIDLIDFLDDSTAAANPTRANASYLEDLQDLFTTTEEDHNHSSEVKGVENHLAQYSLACFDKSDVSAPSFEIPEDWQPYSSATVANVQEYHGPDTHHTSSNAGHLEQQDPSIQSDLSKITDSEPQQSSVDSVESFGDIADDLIQLQEDTHSNVKEKCAPENHIKVTNDMKEKCGLDSEGQAQSDDGWSTVSNRGRKLFSATEGETRKLPTSKFSKGSKQAVINGETMEEQFDSIEDPASGLIMRPREFDFPSKVPLNLDIRRYFDHRDVPDIETNHWLKIPDVPTAKEILFTGRVDVPANTIRGAWPNKQVYLRDHHDLLREDAISPLRALVAEIRANPSLTEKDMKETGGIYEAAHVTGVMFSTRGIATRIEFSLRRTGKQIRWEQSKRLISGGLVALTTTKDAFKTVCKIGVVAARPIAGLLHHPPAIDVFFTNPAELEIDPQEEWLMVEARNAYWESYRHTLCALQKMSHESFPLAEHLVHVQSNVLAPAHLHRKPLKDLSSIATSNPEDYINVNILEGWPKKMQSNMDSSQTDALRRILTKKFAIVQGPPGTGKTYISVEALKLLLVHHRPEDPPIVVAAHTNHALDQLLRHVAQFEPSFIRLGGRSADIEIIKPRSMFEIRQKNPLQAPAGGLLVGASKHRKAISRMMGILLGPLRDCHTSISGELFFEQNLITEQQLESLREGAAGWVTGDGNGSSDPMGTWLGDQLIPFTKRNSGKQYGLDFEEADLEFEQLKELEAERGGGDDEFLDVLNGEWMPLNETLTGYDHYKLHDKKIETLLREQQDMWEIAESYRGLVYRYLQRKYKEALRREFQKAAVVYQKTIHEMKIGRWETDYGYLRQTRVIGMTTTGLSKNRGLIASLKPQIVLIEEAAETLEPHVAVACFDSLEHLILVGDHQQLRGQCAVKDLEGEPFNLAVSLFERMVMNKVEFSQLTSQRRMLPEFRKIMNVIYENLDDHPSVYGRENVPGMGGVNSFFYTHNFLETTDDATSKVNQDEAAMIVGFYDYLVLNGTAPSNITVLTFYNGQRKAILSGLRKHSNLHGFVFKVVTVDSYQGEENEVVLLSLVRNPEGERGGIGFLNVENRVCVALSRARRGFYLFGNHKLLAKFSPLWSKVITILEENPKRIGRSLPITCEPHHKRLEIKHPSEWQCLNGGCDKMCKGTLPCGHPCQMKCHTSEHSMAICLMPCNRPLRCGHPCLEQCFVLQCKCACGNKRATQLWPGRPSVNISPANLTPPANRSIRSNENDSTMLQQSLSISPTPSPRGRVSGAPQGAWQQGPPSARRSLSTMPTPAEAAQIKAYQLYAAGGHKESDKILDARAKATVEEQRQKLARQEMATRPSSKANGTSSVVPKEAEAKGPQGKSGERVKRKTMFIGGPVPRIDEEETTD